MTERKCIGCNETKNRDDLIKITKDHLTDELVVNPSSNIHGRSVYICKSQECINSAFKKDRLLKSLKKNLSNEEKENLRTVLNTMVVVQH